MADFDNVRFPDSIGYGAVGGPGFKTSVAGVASGAEARTQWWETERGEWTVNYTAKVPAERRALLAFFRVVAKGMSNTFRFRDPADYICTAGEGYYVPAETGVGKQMVKRYTFQGIDGTGYTYDRVINKPVLGTITTDAPDLVYSTGRATSGTTWSGQFDCWCRLNVDVAKLQYASRSSNQLVMTWDGIEIVEVVHEMP